MIRQSAWIAVTVVMTVVVFALLAWLTLPAAPPGFQWDDTWYLWMAEWYSGRETYRDIANAMMHARQYPPLFPMMLAAVGVTAGDITPGIVANSLCLALAGAFTSAWLRKEGLNWLVAVSAGLLLVLNPVSLTFIPMLISEPLYLLLSVAALWLASGGPHRAERWLVIGVLAGLAVVTRSAGWPLAIALCIHLFQKRHLALLRGYLPGLVIVVATGLVTKSNLPEAPGYLEMYRSNVAAMNTAYFVQYGVAAWKGWAELWGSVPAGAAAAMLMLPGMLFGLRNASISAWYVLLYMAMLLAWPFPEHSARFLWALMPALFGCMALTATSVPRFRPGRAVAGTVLVLLFVASLPGGLYRSASMLSNPPGDGLDYLARMPDWARAEDREGARKKLRLLDQLLVDIDRIATATASSRDECIYSEFPALVSINARRASFDPPWISLEQVASHRYSCAYYYMLPGQVANSGPDMQARLGDMHEELFRSAAPWNPESTLGVFYRLSRPQ